MYTPEYCTIKLRFDDWITQDNTIYKKMKKKCDEHDQLSTSLNWCRFSRYSPDL